MGEGVRILKVTKGGWRFIGLKPHIFCVGEYGIQ